MPTCLYLVSTQNQQPAHSLQPRLSSGVKYKYVTQHGQQMKWIQSVSRRDPSCFPPRPYPHKRKLAGSNLTMPEVLFLGVDTYVYKEM